MGMLGIKPRAAGSGRKYANHCAMLSPSPIENQIFPQDFGRWELIWTLTQLNGVLLHPK